MNLSPRQIEVIELIMIGDCDKEIAAKLGISPDTVDFHVREILQRLESKTRAHAVAIYILKQSGAL